MAILEKRRAVNQLPRFERYQDTRAGDRAAALRGETPITSAIRQLAGTSGYGPMGESQGFNPMGGGAGPMGGAGKSTVDKFGNMAGQPKTAVTSALKGSTAATKPSATTGAKTAGTTAAGTTSKLPNLTSKTTGTTGKTLTSTGTGAAKVTGAKTPTTTGTKTTGSNIGKTLTSALAGAALGAGTKLAIDKLTGAKKAVAGTDKTSVTAKDTSKTGSTGLTSKTVGTGLTTKTNTLGDNIGKKIVDTGVKKVVDTTKTGTKTVTSPTSVIKKTGTGTTTGTTKTVGPKTPVTGGTKTTKTTGSKTTSPATKGAAGAVTAKTAADIKAENPELTDEEVQAELDRIKAEEESFGVPEGAEDNGDGTYSETVDGVTTTYDADGNIIGMESSEDTSSGDDTGAAGDDLDTETGDEGTTTQVLDDGTVVTLDQNGDVVSYTDADGVEYDADGEVIDGSDTLINGDEDTVTDEEDTVTDEEES